MGLTVSVIADPVSGGGPRFGRRSTPSAYAMWRGGSPGPRRRLLLPNLRTSSRASSASRVAWWFPRDKERYSTVRPILNIKAVLVLIAVQIIKELLVTELVADAGDTQEAGGMTPAQETGEPER